MAPPSLQLIGAFVPQAEDAIATANGPGAVPAFSSPDAVLPRGLAKELQALWGEAARVPARPGAIAWVREAGGPPVRVQVGETIGGATVTQIESRAITLALGARTLTVAFPENPYLAMLRGETDRATPVEESDQIPAELASKILRYQPVMGPSGALGGFRLFPGAEAGALAKLGLAAGDVLLAIEGRPITSSGDLKPLLRALKNPARLRVRVGRGTGPKELTLFANAAPPAGAALRPSSSSSTRPLQGVPHHGLQ